MAIVYYAVKGDSTFGYYYYASQNYTSDNMAIVDPDTLEIKNGKAGSKKYILLKELEGTAAVLVRYSELESLSGSPIYMGKLTAYVEPGKGCRLEDVYRVTLRREEKKDIFVKYQGSLHSVKEVYVKYQGSLHRVKAIYKKEGGELKGREL